MSRMYCGRCRGDYDELAYLTHQCVEYGIPTIPEEQRRRLADAHALRLELARLTAEQKTAPQEPVGHVIEVGEVVDGEFHATGTTVELFDALPSGTMLYALPPDIAALLKRAKLSALETYAALVDLSVPTNVSGSK